MIAGRIALLCTIAAVASAGAQPPAPGNYAIGAGQVVNALSAQGMRVTAGQVFLVAEVVAARPDPELDVLAVGPHAVTSPAGTRARSWVKLGCRTPGTCLPFYALVAMDSTEVAGRHVPPRRLGPARTAVPERSATVMRAGTHATLELTGPEQRIEVAVISLQGGAMGRTIRVATPDYKQFYRAEIVGANRLKGSF